MRLQQTTETVDTTQGYDAEAVRQILARASTLEQETEKDRLSAAQIEELGREIGLSPEAVRRAMGERQGVAHTVHPVQQQHQSLPKAILDTCKPGLTLALVLLFASFWVCQSGPSSYFFVRWICLLMFLLPLLLALVAGWRQRNQQIALLGGGVTTLSAMLAMYIGAAQGVNPPTLTLTVWAFLIGSAAMAGLLNAWIGNFARRKYESWQLKQSSPIKPFPSNER